MLLWACEKKPEHELVGIPQDVYSAIKQRASKNFPNNENLAKTYTDRQIDAYKSFSSYLPSLPAEEYATIIKYCKDVVGDDYVALHSEVEELSQMVEEVKEKLEKLSQEDAEFVKSFFDHKNAIEYKAQLNRAKLWFTIFEDMRFLERRFDKDAFASLKKRYMDNERNTPDNVMPQFYAQSRALERITSYSRRDVSRENMDKIRAVLQKTYPYDYVAQYENLNKFDFSDYCKPNKIKDKVDSKAESLKAQAEQIFRDCIFTKRGEGDDIDVAVLTKIEGRTVILCTKSFIPQKMPVTFGNSAGQIVCSKAFISEEYPLIAMIPDEEPKMFKPIEIVTAQECKNIHEKSLYLIAPDRGGFNGKPVKVFSEDIKYLNFSVDDTYKTTRYQNIKRLDRNAQKIVINIVDSYDVGENAIVFDPESKKLVSIALRYYAYGMIDIGGKTGNIIGHEKSSIPDFVSFVRHFDGVVGATPYPPISSVRFIRMGGMNKWQRLDVPTFWKQKNAIRKYTDINNEYLKFFIRGSYGDALRSFRLSNIAKKYRHDFESRHLSRDSFERRYEAFIIEVLQSMRIDMNKLAGSSTNSIYSIYKGEFAYQVALRQSMYEYMKEYIKDGNVTAFIDKGISINGNDSEGSIGNVNRGGIRRGTNINYNK